MLSGRALTAIAIPVTPSRSRPARNATKRASAFAGLGSPHSWGHSSHFLAPREPVSGPFLARFCQTFPPNQFVFNRPTFQSGPFLARFVDFLHSLRPYIYPGPLQVLAWLPMCYLKEAPSSHQGGKRPMNCHVKRVAQSCHVFTFAIRLS